MKKIIQYIMALMLLLSIAMSVSATTDNIQLPATSSVNNYYTTGDGGPLYSYIASHLNIIDKVRLGAASSKLTIVNGALCSTYPDKEQSYAPSSSAVTQVCISADNHNGAAVQLFKVPTDNSGFQYLGEKDLSNGQIGCFPVQYGNNYVIDWYYCDDTTKTCTNYVSTSSCNNPGNVYTVRSRSCTTAGQVSQESITVAYYDPNAPNQCTPASNNQVVTANGNSSTTSSTSLSTCAGSWQDAQFQKNVLPGATFSGVATFKASQSGKCIFSATSTNTKLEVVTAKGSACGEPDPYVSEATVSVVAGQTYTVNFKDLKARTSPGTYSIYVSSSNGCYKDGGHNTASINSKINVIGTSYWGYVRIFGSIAIILIIIGLVLLAIAKLNGE